MRQNYNIEYLIIGAGVSGLAFAGKLKNKTYMVVDKDDKIGGYCKTFRQNDFVWDYAGHFFHFSHEETQEKFKKLLQAEDTVYSNKNTKIYYKGAFIDYPFQFNIHQLDKDEFIECLCGLFAEHGTGDTSGFKAMLYSKLGAGIADKFLIPYNEKLYACDLNNLDANAMGRFFPKADPVEIVRSFQGKRIKTYNDEFFYSNKGAEAFVAELAKEVDGGSIFTSQKITRIDYQKKIAYTDDMQIRYSRLINTMPFISLLNAAGIAYHEKYTANKVLVFNLGFDAPPKEKGIHWIYYPDKELVFYRVGFYNNILRQEKMSLYVEIGLQTNQDIDIDAYRARVLSDLKKVGIITTQHLTDSNEIVMDPAYVHISEGSQKEKEFLKAELAKHDIYTIGRYGDWTYCSIEDCIMQAYSLAERLECASK